MTTGITESQPATERQALGEIAAYSAYTLWGTWIAGVGVYGLSQLTDTEAFIGPALSAIGWVLAIISLTFGIRSRLAIKRGLADNSRQAAVALVLASTYVVMRFVLDISYGASPPF